MKDPIFHKYFITMCPTYAFIDRANARFNTAMEFKKDYAAILSYAWEIDAAYDQYLRNPDDTSYETLQALGLEQEDPSMDTYEQRKDTLLKLLRMDKENKFRKRYLGDFDESDMP